MRASWTPLTVRHGRVCPGEQAWVRLEGACLRLLKQTLPKNNLEGDVPPTKVGVVTNSQSEFKISVVENSGARWVRSLR